MKKNMIMRFASLLLVVTLLSTCAISGTFAKYTSSATGSDSARVAKWSFKAGGADVATVDEFTFDLFTGEDTIIAPGSTGSFELKLKNESEVNAKYSIDYTATQTNTPDSINIPIKFCLTNSQTPSDWKENIDDLDVTDVSLVKGSAETSVTVYWKWDTATDVSDTALGVKSATAENSAPTVTVSAKVTATQVG